MRLLYLWVERPFSLGGTDTLVLLDMQLAVVHVVTLVDTVDSETSDSSPFGPNVLLVLHIHEYCCKHES